MPKPSSADDVKLMSSYETVKATLLEPQYVDRLDKPLAFWALPNDRRLPTAFLGRTLRDLLATPFPMLAATAGIGRKKLMTFVKLLVRATKDGNTGPDTLNELQGGRSRPDHRHRRRGQLRSDARLRSGLGEVARNGPPTRHRPGIVGPAGARRWPRCPP